MSSSIDPVVVSEDFDFPEIRGKYIVLEKIGEGTFSTVYKARCITSNRIVALKRIFSTSSPNRIYNEIKILNTLG